MVENMIENICIYTKETEIWDAMARISAQETTPGQTFSSAVLMSSTTENPSTEFILGLASFSLAIPSALSSKIDPSHPCLLLIEWLLIMHIKLE